MNRSTWFTLSDAMTCWRVRCLRGPRKGGRMCSSGVGGDPSFPADGETGSVQAETDAEADVVVAVGRGAPGAARRAAVLRPSAPGTATQDTTVFVFRVFCD